MMLSFWPSGRAFFIRRNAFEQLFPYDYDQARAYAHLLICIFNYFWLPSNEKAPNSQLTGKQLVKHLCSTFSLSLTHTKMMIFFGTFLTIINTPYTYIQAEAEAEDTALARRGCQRFPIEYKRGKLTNTNNKRPSMSQEVCYKCRSFDIITGLQCPPYP